MSDHNHSAYAPYDDASLSFDGYGRRARARSPLPMALVGGVVVLLVLCTAVVMVYRSGSKAGAGLPRPVGGGIAAIKTAPSGTQPTEPGAGLEVYSPQNVPSTNTIAASPRFAPAPESPVARPAPPPTPVEVARPAASASKPVSPLAVAKAESQSLKSRAVTKLATPSAPSLKVAAANPAAAAKAPTAPKPQFSPADTTGTAPADEVTTLLGPASRTDAPDPSRAASGIKSSTLSKRAAASGPLPSADQETGSTPATAVSTALPKGPLSPAKLTAGSSALIRSATDKPKPKPLASAADVSKPAPKGGYSVQVGAFASADEAQKGFADAARKAGGAGSGASKSIQTVQKAGKTYYRSTVGGFASKAAAAAYCAAVRAKGGPCIVHGG